MNPIAFPRRMAAIVGAALVSCALPAVAGAADYCVGPNLGCDAPHTVQTLDAALDLADDAADADRVLLGAGTYSPSDPLDWFDYSRADAPVEIVGQGVGQTILTRPLAAAGSVLELDGGPASSVHDLTIRLPENTGNGVRGLDTSSNARRIEIVEDPTQSNQRIGAALYDGGTLEDSTIKLDDADDTWGVRFYAGGGTLRASTIGASVGVYSYFGGSVERSRVIASRTGVEAYRGATAITSSLIRFGASGTGRGIDAMASFPGFDVAVHADGVTIIGAGLPGIPGILARNGPAPDQSVQVDLSNSIIRGASNALKASTAGNAKGHVSIDTAYADYDPSGNFAEGNVSITETNVSNVGDAGFAGAAGGDFHLLPSSPLIDAGDPAAAQALDLDGNPLVADGNADGTARRDLGAYELPVPSADPQGGGDQAGGGQGGGGDQAGGDQAAGGVQVGLPSADTKAPVITRFRATPSLFAVARGRTPLAASVPRGTRFRYTLSEPAKVRLTIQRQLPGGRRRTVGTLTRRGMPGANRVKFTGRLGKRALRPGRYRVRIIATDSAGNRAAPQTGRFRVVRG